VEKATTHDGFDFYEFIIRNADCKKNTSTVCSTLDALINEVAANLTPFEIREGVLHHLVTFNNTKMKDGVVENKWRDLSTFAYTKKDK